MRRDWSLGHGRDGYVLYVLEYPHWVAVLQCVNGWAIGLTRHRWCACRLGEWAYKIGWGRDADGDLRHSLAGTLWDFSSWIETMDWTRASTQESFPVSREVALQIDEELVHESDAVAEAEQKC